MTSRLTKDQVQGVLPALPTPFTADGKIDTRGLERVIAHVLRGGVHGLWVLGSSGEFPALSATERKLVIETAVGAAGGNVPVLVGVAANDIRETIANIERAAQAGADGCFPMLPYYFSADASEGIDFFRQVATSSPLPVILYDNPVTTKTTLDTAAYIELKDRPEIIALKDSSSDFIRFESLASAVVPATGWKLLQGDERLVGASLLWGADGMVAALANVVPGLYVKLHAAASAGDVSTTVELQKRSLALGELFVLKGAPTDGAFFAGLKAALQVLGLCGSAVSKPFGAMPSEKMPAVEKLLDDFRDLL